MTGTIINNGQFPDEIGQLINNPLFYVPDPSVSAALSGAQMYFGLVGADPQTVSNQKKVYSLQQDKAAVSMTQPVICSAGGVPQLNGVFVALGISGDYSLKILSSSGEQIYYVPKVRNTNEADANGVILEESQTVTGGNQTLTYANIEASTSTFYVSSGVSGTLFEGSLLQKDVDYTIDSATEITLINAKANGTVVLGRQADPIGEVLPFRSNANYIFNFSIVADAVSSDLRLGDTVSINDSVSSGDQLGGNKYIVVAGGTGVQDGINFIDLANGLQLQAVSNNYRFETYSEVTNVETSSANILNINLNKGQVFTHTLTENTTVTPVVYNAASGLTTTFTLKLTQDGTGGHTVTWPANFNWSGGTPPVVTSTANAYDRYVFISDDGGVTWDGITSGKDFS